MVPRLSIIIVSYHASPLSTLCLWALEQNHLKVSEVIVIDNTGNDPGLERLAENYSFVKIIRNASNEGFGRASNRGYNAARGEYILFLNPDTIIPLNIEEKIFSFFRKHPKTGAMGVKMIDGHGRFLPESKRNFPYPITSFFKFTGLHKIIHSKNLKQNYYARHIGIDETARVDILSGAFMVITREAMEKTGGFDPRYFLFAEDIDISWQIVQAGYENWYNPNVEIIHFKGLSTKQSNKYVPCFYNSMKLFYLKYYKQKHSGFQKKIITTFIQTIAFFSTLKHFVAKQCHPAKISTFCIESQHCTEALSKLQTQKKIRFITIPSHRTKCKSTYRLLSNLKTDPDELIKQVKTIKNKILFWHKTSGWLFLFEGKNGNSRPIINSKIK